MSLLYIPFTLLYTILIINLGLLFTKNLKISEGKRILGSYSIGALIIASFFHMLSTFQALSSTAVFITTGLLSLAALMQHKVILDHARSSLNYFSNELSSNNKITKYCLIILAVFITLYLLNAATPGRTADAIRYHLPQMKDLKDFQGFFFRPNVHFNFPINFSYLYFPIYLAFDSIGAKISVTMQIIFILIAALEILKGLNYKYKGIALAIILATPLMLLQSTTTTNDLPLIIFSITGILFLEEDKNLSLIQKLIISAFALGLAHGTKYYSLYFGPWYAICLLQLLRREKKSIVQILLYGIAFFTFAFVIASPYYIRNYINTGAPLWPAMLSLFNAPSTPLNLLAEKFLSSQAGVRSFSFYLASIKQLITFVLFPSIFWLLSIITLVRSKQNFIQIKLGVCSFFFIWALMNPYLHGRYSIYLLPFLVILSCSFIEKYLPLRKKLMTSGIALYLLFGLVVNVFYSKDALRYHITQDEKVYHKATWYYEPFQWMNKNLKLTGNQKILAVTSADQTYYLDHPYIKGDPVLTASVPYSQIKELDALETYLKDRQIKYIFAHESLTQMDLTKDFFNLIRASNKFKKIMDKNIEFVRGRVKGEVFSEDVQLFEYAL